MIQYYLSLILAISIHGATVTTRENLEVHENKYVQLTCTYAGFASTANGMHFNRFLKFWREPKT